VFQYWRLGERRTEKRARLQTLQLDAIWGDMSFQFRAASYRKYSSSITIYTVFVVLEYVEKDMGGSPGHCFVAYSVDPCCRAVPGRSIVAVCVGQRCGIRTGRGPGSAGEGLLGLIASMA
jgi:hypothetical protein